MKMFFMNPVAAAALMMLSGTALAQTTIVTATTDLNVRAGPGPQYPVVTVLGANQRAAIEGCLQNSKWCQVTIGGMQGWAYSDYLVATIDNRTVVMTERRPALPSVTYEQTTSIAPDVDGRLIGHVGEGGMIEPIAPPPPPVRTYVLSNEVDPVYLEGEVVVGATLPETVHIREIPDYEYRYVYVNNQPVLVEPRTRRIIYVMR